MNELLNYSPIVKASLPGMLCPHRPAPSQMMLICPGASRARITVRAGSSFRAWMSCATSKLLHSSPERTVTFPARSKAGATHWQPPIPIITLVQESSIRRAHYKRKKNTPFI